jgi:hypothetical protein
MARSARSQKTGKDILERRRQKKEKAAVSKAKLRKDRRRALAAAPVD